MSSVDLHVHTIASDGSHTPAQVVRLAKKLGLGAIAITDHDTVSGCAEALQAGRAAGLPVVPGIELSTRADGVAVHILGYYPDITAHSLTETLAWIVRQRDERNMRIAELMAADGLPVSYEAMEKRFGEVIGRPHFALTLVELGMAKSVPEAFLRYLNRGKPYFLPRKMLPVERAIQTIVRSGGVAVMAHPFQYKLDDAQLRALLHSCMELGLRGMECYYSGYSAEQIAYLCALAEELGLIKTGGSDFHGLPKPQIALGTGTGDLNVPYSCYETLKAAAEDRRS